MPRCSPRAREFSILVNFCVRRTVAELRGFKVAQFSDGLFSPYKTRKTYRPVTNLEARAQGLHRRMIPIFLCGSRRSKKVPSGSGVFLRLLVGELGPPNLLKFLPMANVM